MLLIKYDVRKIIMKKMREFLDKFFLLKWKNFKTQITIILIFVNKKIRSKNYKLDDNLRKRKLKLQKLRRQQIKFNQNEIN